MLMLISLMLVVTLVKIDFIIKYNLKLREGSKLKSAVVIIT